MDPGKRPGIDGDCGKSVNVIGVTASKSSFVLGLRVGARQGGPGLSVFVRGRILMRHLPYITSLLVARVHFLSLKRSRVGCSGTSPIIQFPPRPNSPRLISRPETSEK
jgi:hypothetical protein